jgi:hypothetical protein
MTAVEWLKNEMAIKVLRSGRLSKSTLDLFEQAEEMEKQQIENAFDHHRCIGNFDNGEKYYNETYKKT